MNLLEQKELARKERVRRAARKANQRNRRGNDTEHHLMHRSSVANRRQIRREMDRREATEQVIDLTGMVPLSVRI